MAVSLFGCPFHMPSMTAAPVARKTCTAREPPTLTCKYCFKRKATCQRWPIVRPCFLREECNFAGPAARNSSSVQTGDSLAAGLFSRLCPSPLALSARHRFVCTAVLLSLWEIDRAGFCLFEAALYAVNMAYLLRLRPQPICFSKGNTVD